LFLFRAGGRQWRWRWFSAGADPRHMMSRGSWGGRGSGAAPFRRWRIRRFWRRRFRRRRRLGDW
jgi:hypothetical protein